MMCEDGLRATAQLSKLMICPFINCIELLNILNNYFLFSFIKDITFIYNTATRVFQYLHHKTNKIRKSNNFKQAKTVT